MAKWQIGTDYPGTGFTSDPPTLTLPLDNRRSVGLYGGGPGGAKLTVSADPASIIRLNPERTLAWHPKALPADSREFWIDGIGVGRGTLSAKQSDGTDYSAPLTVIVTPSTDKDTIKAGFDQSRTDLHKARAAIEDLVAVLDSGGPTSSFTLTAAQHTVWDSAVKWLNLTGWDPFSPVVVPRPSIRTVLIPGALFTAEVSVVKDLSRWTYRRHATLNILRKAVALMKSNEALTTSIFVRVPVAGSHAQTEGDLTLGVEAGDLFYTHDGPLCRTQVMTHELFHLVGVGHGIDPLSGPTIHRTGITPEQSLNSADNLAQLVADIATMHTDSCTRNNE